MKMQLLTNGGEMNKLALISALREESNISKTDAAAVVQTFFDSMADALVKGDRIEIMGLCSFYVKEYKSYTGRNPRTGEKLRVQSKKAALFQVRPGTL